MLLGPTLRAELASPHLWNRHAVQGTLLAHRFAVQTPAEPAAQPLPSAQMLLQVRQEASQEILLKSRHKTPSFWHLVLILD